MPVDEMKNLVRRTFEEVINQRRLELIDELFATNFIGYLPEPVEGRIGYRQFIERFLNAFSEGNFTIEEMLVIDNRVVTRWTARGTHDGNLNGIAATGKAVAVSGISIKQFNREGLIAEEWQNSDMVSLLVQIGVISA